MSIDICGLTDKYAVKIIQNSDIQDVYELCKGNPDYYMYMKSELTYESVEQQLKALPPDKGYEDKYFMGFYKEGVLNAFMDLIAGYPDKETAYIGWFMMDKSLQNKGAGTEIIEDTIKFLKKEGFAYVRLGCIKENAAGESFWKKNMFLPTGAEAERENYTAVVMQRMLN